MENSINNENNNNLIKNNNFISSKPDSNETGIMNVKSDNVEIMMGSETNEIIE